MPSQNPSTQNALDDITTSLSATAWPYNEYGQVHAVPEVELPLVPWLATLGSHLTSSILNSGAFDTGDRERFPGDEVLDLLVEFWADPDNADHDPNAHGAAARLLKGCEAFDFGFHVDIDQAEPYDIELIRQAIEHYKDAKPGTPTRVGDPLGWLVEQVKDGIRAGFAPEDALTEVIWPLTNDDFPFLKAAYNACPDKEAGYLMDPEASPQAEMQDVVVGNVDALFPEDVRVDYATSASSGGRSELRTTMPGADPSTAKTYMHFEPRPDNAPVAKFMVKDENHVAYEGFSVDLPVAPWLASEDFGDDFGTDTGARGLLEFWCSHEHGELLHRATHQAARAYLHGLTGGNWRLHVVWPEEIAEGSPADRRETPATLRQTVLSRLAQPSSRIRWKPTGKQREVAIEAIKRIYDVTKPVAASIVDGNHTHPAIADGTDPDQVAVLIETAVEDVWAGSVAVMVDALSGFTLESVGDPVPGEDTPHVLHVRRDGETVLSIDDRDWSVTLDDEPTGIPPHGGATPMKVARRVMALLHA